jgi:basic membrane protein A
MAATTACGGATAADTRSQPDAKGPSLALVTSEPVGSNQFLTGIVDGFETATTSLDASKRVFESKGDPQSMQSNVDAAIRAKPDLIVLTGFSFLDIMNVAAPANPEQKFLIVDSCIPNAPKNVTCAQFRVWEAAYLAGV